MKKETNHQLTVTSPAFSHMDFIPIRFTCEGDNISPPIDIENIPTEAKTLALIVDDPDAPRGTFDHWIMWNISPDGKIKENSAPGVEGRNSAAENKYYAPCPPTGTHHYHFKVYALDTKLDLRDNADKGVLTEAMQGHVIGSGEIVGLYESKKVKRPPDRVNAEV